MPDNKSKKTTLKKREIEFLLWGYEDDTAKRGCERSQRHHAVMPQDATSALTLRSFAVPKIAGWVRKDLNWRKSVYEYLRWSRWASIKSWSTASRLTILLPRHHHFQNFESCAQKLRRVTDIPHQNPSRIKTRETRLYYYNKMRDKYAKSKAIDAAVAAIKRGKFIHYSDIAKKYKCDRSALSKRVRGLTKTKKDADSFWR